MDSPRMVAQRRHLAQVIGSPPAPAAPAGRSGLPDPLRAGIESLSGLSMDKVQVHYNSAKPAQMQAHAYAQGRDIHLGPGQERHLPHEAWHVVQQAQGRVQPTLQLRGAGVNDDAALEREADTMGARAAAARAGPGGPGATGLAPLQTGGARPVQRYLIASLNGHPYRIANDGRLAVAQDKARGGTAAFSIDNHHAVLNGSRPGTQVELYPSGQTVDIPNTNGPAHRLHRILARNHLTQTQGEAMTLENDCGGVSAQVMGHYDYGAPNMLAGIRPRRGMHSGNQHTSAGYAATIQQEMMASLYQQMEADCTAQYQQQQLVVNQHQMHLAGLNTQVNTSTFQIALLNGQLQTARQDAAAKEAKLQHLKPAFDHFASLEQPYVARRDYWNRQLQERQANQNNIFWFGNRQTLQAEIQHCQQQAQTAETERHQLLAVRATEGTVGELFQHVHATRAGLAQDNSQLAALTTALAQEQATLHNTQQAIPAATTALQLAQQTLQQCHTAGAGLAQTRQAAAALAGNPEHQANAYIMHFHTLPANIQAHWGQRVGFNEHAAPEVGETYVIARGGNPVPGGGWNYHWGAVVLKSGGDSITLENDASTAPAGANNAWRFQMYGRLDQSFHTEHNHGAYNSHPTTIRVGR